MKKFDGRPPCSNSSQIGTRSVPASSGSGSATVTFPIPFASVPHVSVNITTLTGVWMAQAINVTETGFTARVARPDGGTTGGTLPVSWCATGPL